MKKLLVLFVCVSMLFSCFDDERFGTPAGVLLLPFLLLPRTATEEANMIKPIEEGKYRIHVVQKGETIYVLFQNKLTKKLEKTLVHEKLVITKLNKIMFDKKELKFLYPNGTLGVHCKSWVITWYSVGNDG